MAADNIGGNLVGSWLRYVGGCPFIIHNTQLPGKDGGRSGIPPRR